MKACGFGCGMFSGKLSSVELLEGAEPVEPETPTEVALQVAQIQGSRSMTGTAQTSLEASLGDRTQTFLAESPRRWRSLPTISPAGALIQY